MKKDQHHDNSGDWRRIYDTIRSLKIVILLDMDVVKIELVNNVVLYLIF